MKTIKFLFVILLGLITICPSCKKEEEVTIVEESVPVDVLVSLDSYKSYQMEEFFQEFVSVKKRLGNYSVIYLPKGTPLGEKHLDAGTAKFTKEDFIGTLYGGLIWGKTSKSFTTPEKYGQLKFSFEIVPFEEEQPYEVVSAINGVCQTSTVFPLNDSLQMSLEDHTNLREYAPVKEFALYSKKENPVGRILHTCGKAIKFQLEEETLLIPIMGDGTLPKRRFADKSIFEDIEKTIAAKRSSDILSSY